MEPVSSPEVTLHLPHSCMSEPLVQENTPPQMVLLEKIVELQKVESTFMATDLSA